jgi:hypothetical protein
MNLWVIRSVQENHHWAVGRLPSREIGPKELSSTLPKASFQLVRRQLVASSPAWSPGRYPGSAQANRVSPTAHNLLSTSPVDNVLFRWSFTAYGSGIDPSRRHTSVSVDVTTLPNTYSIGAEARQVSDGLGGSVQRIDKRSKG